MRDCIFLVADTNMAAAFAGFLRRDGFHHSLGTCPFNCDPSIDILVDRAGNDPGVYKRAHEILLPFVTKYRYGAVVLDNAWDGSPGVERIQQDIKKNLLTTGWTEERVAVIVIDPELEVWIWQDSTHIATAFGFTQAPSLRQWLREQGIWLDGNLKPSNPKVAIETTLRVTRRPRSSAMYQQITSRVSIRGCQDPAFQVFKETMQRWFPTEGIAGLNSKEVIA